MRQIDSIQLHEEHLIGFRFSEKASAPSRSDETTIAVGFNPRFAMAHVFSIA